MLRLCCGYTCSRGLLGGQGGADFGFGQVGVGAKFLDGNEGAGGLVEAGADALEQQLPGLVAVAGEGGCLLGVDANLGHSWYEWVMVGWANVQSGGRGRRFET